MASKTVNVKMNREQLEEYMDYVYEACGCDENDPHYKALFKLHQSNFDLPDYELTEKQKKFVRKAKREGFAICYNYSGRFMFGEKCPAVVAPNGAFSYKGCRVDNMGLDMVYYLPR